MINFMRLGKIISKSNSTIVCWAMGITQHKNSVATIQEIVNLQLLGGHIDDLVLEFVLSEVILMSKVIELLELIINRIYF